MTSRISGLFKSDHSRDVSKERMSKEVVPEHDVGPAKTQPSPPSRPVGVSRQSSTGGKEHMVTTTATANSVNSEKTTQSQSRAPKMDEHGHMKKFWINEDGTHEHYLKAAKRQQKLSEKLRSMWDKKSKDGEHDMSLMADWVMQKKTEQEKAQADAKGGPGHSQSLVQKYGKCQEIVGHGAFGIVRVAHKTDSKDPKREQLYAVKEFRQRPGESAKKYQKRLTSEFCLSSSMQHPNVIATLDLLKDDKGDYCEVMEYCAGGDLYTLILAAGQLEMLEADCYFKQLMRGVHYMHEMGVAHRDLKPENLLLTQHGGLKITDFGNGECFRMAWEKEAHMTAGLCGSAPYIAPEEYVDNEFDPRAVDVWACGIIYMAMRTGRHLWRTAVKGEDEFYTRYLDDRKEESGFRPIEILKRVSRLLQTEQREQDTNETQRPCRNVIYSILDPNPNRRLNAHQVLSSEWVNDIKLCHAGEQGY